MTNTRVHGNGYIQVDLGPNLRLNVWVAGLPRQKVATPIHNHTFSFESTVLRGALKNTEIRVVAGERLHVYRAVTHRGEDTRLMLDGDRTVDTEAVDSWVIPEGQRYYFPFGLFHDAQPLTYPTVTLMRKLDVGAYPDPLVLCPVGLEPDNGFFRYQMDEAELDAIVLQALKGLTPAVAA